MSADMLTAAIAVPADRTKPIDFERGRLMVEETAGPESFRFDDPESQLEELVEDFDPDVHLDAEGEPTPEVIKRVGRRIIDELEEALDSSDTDTIEVAGYRLYLTGGLSSGDSPTDAADAIWHAHHLPVTVLLAMGFIPDCRRPLSRTNGNPGPVTDTDIVDAIALGLGTKPEWSGADELEWIANAIGSVRPHPGDRDPADYHAEFTEQHGFDPVDDNFLIGYVSQYDNQEGGD